MYNYRFPYYGRPIVPAYPYYPTPYYPGVMPYYGNTYSSNIIGSAIANQSLINTGSMFGVNQIANPTVIW